MEGGERPFAGLANDPNEVDENGHSQQNSLHALFSVTMSRKPYPWPRDMKIRHGNGEGSH
ncbi:hypothetical protein [Sediminimonas qiaohouensis]|uniref:hypothetical protein n=1 Tax=Sediminimonas qiaohouensis TaxID=552061 RepID=UPI0012ECCD7A|nr:hypothetical protein [Sediminimonas qiaohouensis]